MSRIFAVGLTIATVEARAAVPVATAPPPGIVIVAFASPWTSLMVLTTGAAAVALAFTDT